MQVPAHGVEQRQSVAGIRRQSVVESALPLESPTRNRAPPSRSGAHTKHTRHAHRHIHTAKPTQTHNGDKMARCDVTMNSAHRGPASYAYWAILFQGSLAPGHYSDMFWNGTMWIHYFLLCTVRALCEDLSPSRRASDASRTNSLGLLRHTEHAVLGPVHLLTGFLCLLLVGGRAVYPPLWWARMEQEAALLRGSALRGTGPG